MMNLKSLLFIILVVGFMLCAVCPSFAAKTPSLDDVIQKAAEKMEERLDKGTKVALVNVQSPTAQFSEYVLNYLESILVNNGKLIVVDRSNLDKVRQELGFQMSGEVSDESAKTIGKMLGAGAIVTGSLLAVGNSYRLTLKAINVETATVAASYLADIAKNDRVKALLTSSKTTTAAGVPSITIVNNTGTALYKIGFFPTGSSDNLITFSENIANKTSKRLSLPPIDSTKKYSIIVLNTDDTSYVKENLSIKSDITITFNQSDEYSQTTTTTSTAPATPATSGYKIGDIGPAGGIIFYDKGNNRGGWRYLEAAPANTEKMAPSYYALETKTSLKVGDVKYNTKNFIEINEKKGGGINTAPWICNDLNINGFNDWYLPTLDELLYMYNNLFSKGLGNFKSEKYWSSYIGGWGNIFCLNFYDGSENKNSFYDDKLRVRAIRQF